jgi:hypothetical protein
MVCAANLLPAMGVFVLCSCTKLSESTLTGTWRAETTETVQEVALRSDHTFTSWLSAKNALTTPSCPTSAGEWRLQRKNIVVHLTTHTAVDSWEHLNEYLHFTVVQLKGDTMQLTDSKRGGVVTYKRLFPDYSVQACRRPPVDSDVFGVWRVHYNTHDYEIVLGRDHSFGVFANMPNWRQPQKGAIREQLWTGTWRIQSGKLLTDAKTVPSFNGELIETKHGGWPIIGVETGRIAVRDGPVRYVWQRLN